MKATDLLKKQHRSVRALFRKADKSDNPRDRRQLMEQIERELKVHTRIEQEVFYPAVREVNKKAEDMVMKAYEEHHVVDLILGELPSLDPADERFHAKLTVLAELVEDHIEEEEQSMFKLAEKIGPDELKELGMQMAEMAGMDTGRQRRAA